LPPTSARLAEANAKAVGGSAPSYRGGTGLWPPVSGVRFLVPPFPTSYFLPYTSSFKETGQLICWSCNKVKGKRPCPARGASLICSKCCGTKRRVEIRCPDNCPYLHGEHDPRWEPPARKTEETQFISLFASLKREEIPLLVFLHHLLLQARQNLASDLTDQETHEVVSLLARTFNTLSKGIVYEHRSESPRLQVIIRWTRQILEKRQDIPGTPSASDSEIKEMLETISSALQTYAEQAAGARSYLDTAERVFRSGLAHAPPLDVPGEEAPQSGSLIIEP